MATCIRAFFPGTDVMLRYHRVTNGVHLDIAAVVKRTTDRGCVAPDASISTPPARATEGGGSTIGPFFVDFYLPQRVLRVDGRDLLSMPTEHNVALLIEEKDTLRLIATDTVAPLLPVEYYGKKRERDIVAAVRSRLIACDVVIGFVRAPVP